MKNIFDASNSIEANLLKNILQQEGITAYIKGEYLQGGMGELPAMGLVSIMVEDEDQFRAAQVIRNWESGDYSIENE